MSPAISLCFDDKYVDHWWATRPLFNTYGIYATFCVCRLHMLDAGRIQKLRDLQDDGHEISFHTRNHPFFPEYVEEFGFDHWAENEVIAGIRDHAAHGFPATSFAPPHNLVDRDTKALAERLFAVTRGAGPFSKPDRDVIRRIYTTNSQLVHSLGSLDFQRKGHLGWDWTEAALDQVATIGGAAVFSGHDIREKATDVALYATWADLDRFFDAMVLRGLDHKLLSSFNPDFKPDRLIAA